MRFYFVSNPMLDHIKYLWKICIILLSSTLLYATPLHGAKKEVDFSSLNLQQLLDQADEVAKTGDNIRVDFIAEFTKRLIDLTYFERDVSIEDRENGGGAYY